MKLGRKVSYQRAVRHLGEVEIWEDKTVQTVHSEEERWLMQRWHHEEYRCAPSTGTADARDDGNAIHQGVRGGNDTNENACRPTLEKLYAARRKRARDLERQIEQAMTGNPE